jgi:hypothetical protein
MLSYNLFLKPDIKTMTQYKANFKSFMTKYDEIKASHKGEFVAVYNGSNIEGDKDLNILRERIRDKVEVMDSVFTKYVPKNDYLLVV